MNSGSFIYSIKSKVTAMQNEPSLKGNIIRVLFANFLVTAVSFIGSFVFPRILSIESYAQYHQFTLYVSYIAVLHLGFPSGMVIKYAGKNVDNINKSQLKSEVLITFYTLSFFSVIAIIVSMLTDDERAWLDDYHRRVYERLSPHLLPDERQWLERACSPL